MTEPLSLVLGAYPQVAGIADGSIAVDGVSLEAVATPSLQDAFKRMCREVCFDVCEMSITGYLLARRYDLPFTALPVFPVRGFPQSHAAIVVNRDAGGRTPHDLEGKRVGARAYTGTASLWVRGVLRDEYGVDLDKVTWVSAEDEHVPQFRDDAPPNVSYEIGDDIEAMVVAGELAAAIGVDASKSEKLQPLIPDARATAAGFVRRSGIYQINHTVVVRDEVLARHPGLAQALFDAFVEAKTRWLATAAPLQLAHDLDLADGDPFPYGVSANQPSIDALLRYAETQHLMPSRIEPEALFPLL